MSLSSTFVEAINAGETDEAFLVLLTIESGNETIRVTSDGVDTTSNGNTFTAFPFEVSLPTQDSDNSGALAQLRIDNVDRRVTEDVRAVSESPEVTIEIVLASDPDTIEVTWPKFKLSNVRITDTEIEGDLVLEVWDRQPFPAARFDPANFPGLF